ncbi:MarR family transcriptional regulator [Gemmobacter fulvus]|uniref:MarR family winged helix-turn-helix transcriptional regulator n=1 Tax=Gemmobacter fulvus TaxID=2840474 RepID=UPI001FE7E3D3|nr:MarR family transcriptional regulator [Gemmobacter fulvus]MDQ1849771.1 MarR family transcriptional regulator [Gemmobacter fulvus]
MPTDVSRFAKEDWPFYWISRVNARYVQVLEKRLKPLGIDVPHWRVLISLYESQYLSISEIAEMSTMRLNTTTKVVQRMIGDGLVTTRVRPTDGRVTEACLTEKGDRLRALALVEAREVFALSFPTVSASESAALNSILAKVFTQIDKL